MGRKSVSHIRKPEIIENLYHVVAEEGLTGTTLDKVARRMGVNSGLLVHYFRTKREMMLALVDYIAERYESAYLASLEAIEDAGDRLEFLLDSIWGEGWRDMIDQRVFFACYYLSLSDKVIHEKFRTAYARLQALLAAEIQRAMQDRVLPDGNAAMLADQIIILIEGLLFYRNVRGDELAYDEYAARLRKLTLEMLHGG